VVTAVSAHHYKLIGLEITTNGATYTADLVGLGGDATRAQRLGMKGFVVDRCFVHPAEISASNLFSGTVLRSSGRGISLQVVDGWVINSYIAGFAGKFLNDPGHGIDSYGIYSVVGPGPLHIINNYIEAQFNNVFTGGGSQDTVNTATMSNMSQSLGTFSTVANLNVGDYVAMEDEDATDVNANERWQVAKINSISGTNVTFTIERGQYSPQIGTPDNGGVARWNGDHVHNVEIRGNSIWKPDVWGTSMADSNTTNTGFPNAYKSYIEFKDCVDCTVTGNYFYSGIGTAMAFTARNQYGSAPWLTVRNLIFQNNLINGYQNNAFGIQLKDNERPSVTGGNLTITNNLIINERSFTGSSAFFVLSGVNGISFTHNTILQSGATWKGTGTPSTGVVVKDNIMQSGGYGPTCDGGVLSFCFPSYQATNNVIVDSRTDPNPALSSFISGTNFYPTSQSAIGFLDPANGNYALAPNSPYRNAATDGKDLGVDMAALQAALGNTNPAPTATPTPTPTPTPTLTPTPTPTPPGTLTATVSFVQTDTATQGNWKSAYGADGFNTVSDATSYPSYAQVATAGSSDFTWAASTSDPRGLQKAATSDRIAAAWYADSFFDIDINFIDGQTHQVALYCLDWDTTQRAQTLNVVDAGTNILLDSRSVTSFNGGKYVVWNIQGHVKINVNKSAGVNVVVNGIYFGGSQSTPTPTPTPTPGGPIVSVTAPTSGANFVPGSNIQITAVASAPGRSVSKVDFFRNGTMIGTDTSTPYVFMWNNAVRGNYTVTAQATDDQGASTMSAPISVSVKSSPSTTGKAKGHANSLIGSIASFTGGIGSSVESYLGAGVSTTALLTPADLDSLAQDIQAAYADFQTESSLYGNASRIDSQMRAALYFTQADSALLARTGLTSSIRNHLLRAAAHLAMSEDLMLLGNISATSLAQAQAANARTNITIGPATTGYGVTTASSVAQSSLATVVGNSNTSPLAPQTLFATLASDGSAPYELAGMSATLGGVAVQILYVSSTRVLFVVPANSPLGSNELLVTSQDGFVSRGVVTVANTNSRIMTTADDDSGSAVFVNANTRKYTNIHVTTPENFGSDKRTRLMIFASGVSGTAANTYASNDINLNGVIRPNLAESVQVEARKSNGQIFMLSVEYAGREGTLPGVDQLNVVLASGLQGAGTVRLTLIINGQRSNGPTVVIN
jgi:uncharacterized protein (TIGR03437 family)